MNQIGMLRSMKLGDWLRETGTARSVFADLIGVDEVSVTRYVNGMRMPRPATLALIRKETNGKVTADDFVDGKENSPCAASNDAPSAAAE